MSGVPPEPAGEPEKTDEFASSGDTGVPLHLLCRIQGAFFFHSVVGLNDR